ncbi:hypothetical protein L0Z72_09100, partial [candidate division KSB1 bacterium]|nr:hypothetical protein [candidate division KSB1 bacterium]
TEFDEKDWHEELAKIKENSARFLGDYMAAMEYLNPEQWITLIVDFDGFGRWVDPFLLKKSAQQLIIKVQKKNITAYHNGSIKFDDLKNSIQYAKTDEQESEIDNDIDIFSDIMESYLQNTRGNNEFHLIDDITGFYLQGYGAIFLIKANFESHIINIISRAKGINNFSIQTYSSVGDSIDIKTKIKNLEDQIITIFSRFGHTLKQLGANEWLEVAIHVNSASHQNDFSKVVIKVKKNEIDALKNQKLSMNDFKRRITIVKY